jgi:hypothetical protein
LSRMRDGSLGSGLRIHAVQPGCMPV